MGGSVLTWKELSDILEEQDWNGKDWDGSQISNSRIEEVMRYIDWNNARYEFFVRADDNKRIEDAIEKFHDDPNQENMSKVITSIYYRMYENGTFDVPIINTSQTKSENGTILYNSEYVPLTTEEGKNLVVALTFADKEIEEKYEEKYPALYLADIKDLLKEVYEDNEKYDGIIFNPHDDSKTFILTNEFMEIIFNLDKPKNYEKVFIGDIKTLAVDAIVNINENQSGINKAGDDITAEYIIYANKPTYDEDEDGFDGLKAYFWKSLRFAKEKHLHSIAFPQANYANEIANYEIIAEEINCIKSWFQRNPEYGMSVAIVFNTREDYQKYSGQKYVNKKLVAQFIASVDISTLPTADLALDELDEFEINEIIEQSVTFEYVNQNIYVIPSFNFNEGKYSLDCYKMENNRLVAVNYIPSWQELSDTLEKQEWNGDWVSDSDVEKVMKYIDWNNIEGND